MSLIEFLMRTNFNVNLTINHILRNNKDSVLITTCNTSYCMPRLLHIACMILSLQVSDTQVTTEWVCIFFIYCSFSVCCILQDHIPLVRTNLYHGYQYHRNHQIKQILLQTAHKINQSRAYQLKTFNIIKNA